MVKFNGEELSEAIEDFAKFVGMNIKVTVNDSRKKAMDLIKEGKELINKVELEKKEASEQLTINNYKIFGNEIKDSVKDLDKCEESNEKEWAYCFDLGNDYEVSLIKLKKKEIMIDLEINTIAELEELREDGEDYDDVIKKIVKGGNKKW